MTYKCITITRYTLRLADQAYLWKKKNWNSFPPSLVNSSSNVMHWPCLAHTYRCQADLTICSPLHEQCGGCFVTQMDWKHELLQKEVCRTQAEQLAAISISRIWKAKSALIWQFAIIPEPGLFLTQVLLALEHHRKANNCEYILTWRMEVRKKSIQLHLYEEVKVTAPQFMLCSQAKKKRLHPKLHIITFFTPFSGSFPSLYVHIRIEYLTFLFLTSWTVRSIFSFK